MKKETKQNPKQIIDKKFAKKQFNILKKSLLPSILSTLLVCLIFLTYQMVFYDKFFPITYIGDTNVTFLTKNQAAKVLAAKFNLRSQNKLQYIYEGDAYPIDLSNSQASLYYQDVIGQAFKVGRNGSYFKQLQEQAQLIFNKNDFVPTVDLNLTEQFDQISKQVDQPAKNAIVTINETGDVVIIPSETGKSLNQEALKKLVAEYFIFGDTSLNLPVEVSSPVFDTEKAENIKEFLKKLQEKPISLIYEKNTWELDAKTLITLINTDNAEGDLIDQNKLHEYIKKIASEIDQPVLEPLFKFDGTRVNEFRPSQDGLEVDIPKTAQQLLHNLKQGEIKEVSIIVNAVKPKNQTDEINKLGIKDLLGRGVSHFAGSIPNRIYNVNLTASRLNGVLVAPGEEFSFLRAVGDISAATGFKQAYVIKEGRTVLDDGGGVCQDSTTLFRAVLNAGLPITDRTAHAYRVTYYEQGGFGPGLDATVFYPSVDFRFKNDTPSHILIQAYTNGTTLYVDLYGTSDGRTAEVTKPVILSQTPPLPEIRQDDPTLPKGTIKQVDWAASGAKVNFKRTVTKNGEVVTNENWNSSYRSWQAVYLVGTKE